MKQIEKNALFHLHASFCKTLADANRLLIISELAGGETSVGELAKRLGLAQANVSKHLGIMRERGLVVSRREGVNAYYSLIDKRIFEAIQLLTEVQMEHIERRHRLVQEGLR